uniref:Uncharacterized protein n=1 Tax=Glossina pallidipes TaxID=7398 RepID=A0A1B0A7R3_GLOPL
MLSTISRNIGRPKTRTEAMIFDLAQSVQAFLLKHNKQPRGSFYDEMLRQKQQREQELLDLQKQRETLDRQNRIDEVEKRKEMFKSEANIENHSAIARQIRRGYCNACPYIKYTLDVPLWVHNTPIKYCTFFVFLILGCGFLNEK